MSDHQNFTPRQVWCRGLGIPPLEGVKCRLTLMGHHHRPGLSLPRTGLVSGKVIGSTEVTVYLPLRRRTATLLQSGLSSLQSTYVVSGLGPKSFMWSTSLNTFRCLV